LTCKQFLEHNYSDASRIPPGRRILCGTAFATFSDLFASPAGVLAYPIKGWAPVGGARDQAVTSRDQAVTSRDKP